MTLDLDPNWGKILDPMYLDPQHLHLHIMPNSGTVFHANVKWCRVRSPVLQRKKPLAKKISFARYLSGELVFRGPLTRRRMWCSSRAPDMAGGTAGLLTWLEVQLGTWPLHMTAWGTHPPRWFLCQGYGRWMGGGDERGRHSIGPYTSYFVWFWWIVRKGGQKNHNKYCHHRPMSVSVGTGSGFYKNPWPDLRLIRGFTKSKL